MNILTLGGVRNKRKKKKTLIFSGGEVRQLRHRNKVIVSFHLARKQKRYVVREGKGGAIGELGHSFRKSEKKTLQEKESGGFGEGGRRWSSELRYEFERGCVGYAAAMWGGCRGEKRKREKDN